MSPAREGAVADSADSSRGGARSGAAVFLRNGLPWLVAAGCLVYAFHVVPIEACLAAFRAANLVLFLPTAVACVLAWFLLDSATYAYTFSRFCAPLSWRDARSLRALTYLLTLIHWHVAKAAVVLRLHTAHGVGLMSATSALLVHQLVGLMALGAFVSLGASAEPRLPGARTVATAGTLATTGIALGVALLRTDRLPIWPLDVLRRTPLLQAFRRVTLTDVAVIGFAKTAYQMVFVLVYAVGLRAFGLDLSLARVVVATVILQAVGGLPISPSGFGTQQAAMLLLFADPAANGRDQAAILAFGVSLPITTLALRGLLACLYLGDLSRGSAAPVVESASASSSATTRV